MISKYTSKLSWIDIFLFLFVLFIFFYGLGNYGLLDNNEGLYAQIPYEMLQRNDFVIPYLNDVPYIEKPPLLYWLIAASYKLFGVSESIARLIPACSGAGLCLITYIFVRLNISVISARLSLMILSTMSGFIIFSRMVFFDVVMTFFLSSSLFLFYMWHQKDQPKYLKGAYVCLAFATLTKGFVAVFLAFLVSLIYLILAKDLKQKWQKFLDFWGIGLFLAIISPWHIMASFQQPGFTWFYFINEHVLRFLGCRVPKDYYHGSWSYYIFRLSLSTLPWGLYLPLFLKPHKNYFSLTLFLKVWIWGFFCFFSLSQAKANYYLVTIFPPLAIFLSLKIESFLQDSFVTQVRQRLAIGVFLGFPFMGILVIFLKSYFSLKAQSIINIIPPLYIYSWMMGSLLIVFLRLRVKKIEFWPEILMSTTLVAPLLIALWIVPKYDFLFSSKKFMKELPSFAFPICLYQNFESISTVRFYYHHSLPIIESKSHDLAFGFSKPEGFLLNIKKNNLIQQPYHSTYIIVEQGSHTHFKIDFPQAQFISKKGNLILYHFYSNLQKFVKALHSFPTYR